MKKPNTRGHRYWRYTDETNTTTEMRVFKADPGPPWTRGTKPRTPEADAQLKARLSKAGRGKPKSEITKLRMSHAKLNRAKSPEHVAAMSRSHLERVARVKELQRRYPNLSFNEATKLEKELRKKEKT